MLKNSLRVVCVFVVVLVAFLTIFQIEKEESDYPLGTRFAVAANFSETTGSKEQLLNRIDQLARDHGSTILLTKAQPGNLEKGLDVYYFGVRPHVDTHNKEVPWFSLGMSGVLRPSSQLGAQSLVATYSFYDGSTYSAFKNYVKEVGGTVSTVPTARSSWVLRVSSEDSGSLVLLAMVLLIASISWGWVSRKNTALLVFRQSGKSIWFIVHTCLSDFGKLVLPPVLGTIIVIELVSLMTRRGPGLTTFVSLSVSTTVFILLILFLFVLLSLFFFLPTTKALASRQLKTTMSRQVGSAFKLGALFIVLAALPGALANQASAITQYDNASVWRRASNVVSLQYSSDLVTLDPESTNKYSLFFKQMEQSKTMLLSYQVGSYFTDESRNPGDLDPTFDFGSYDQVIVTNAEWLRLMKLPDSSLKKIKPADLSPELARNLAASNSLWLAKGSKDSLATHAYSWTGSTLFPASNPNDSVGSFGKAKHPLILLFDHPAAQLNIENFLFPAVTSRNVMFADEQALYKALQKYGLAQSFYAATSVADSALVLAQTEQRIARLSGLAALTSLVIILFCALQSARTWASERIRSIFLLHTAGHHYMSILRMRIMLSLLSTAVIGVASLSLIQSWSLLAHPYPLLIGVLAAYFIMEILFGLLQSRAAFRRSVSRGSA